MKLELKYVAPYLPYRLKGKYVNEETIWICDPLIDEIDYSENKLPLFHFIDYNSCNILLKPLSDLTKEIEHSGEEFIPYEILYKKWLDKNESTYSHVSEESTESIFGLFIDVLYDEKGYDELQHWIYQDLIKWHFDVFGLIKKGLAIDINTLGK